MTDQGAGAILETILEVGIAIAYLVLVLSIVVYGVVPEYRASGATAVGDRALAETGMAVTDLVMSPADRAEQTLDIPATIDGEPYRIRGSGDELILDHPSFHQAQPLPHHHRIDRVKGTLVSNRTATITSRFTPDGAVVVLDGEQP